MNGIPISLPPQDSGSVYEELALLHDSANDPQGRSKDHELRTAPIVTRDAYVAAGYHDAITQYGVLGRALHIFNKSQAYSPTDPRLYINTNAPFSAVVCGVQGSGKSHTVSILLESMFIPNLRPLGFLQKPLSGLVLHFGEGGTNARPSEAAWIALSNLPTVQTPPVKVYVSRSSLKTMTAVYAPLGERVTVEPLLLKKDELDAQAFLSMMAVGSSESAPLYIQGVLVSEDFVPFFLVETDKFQSILRDLGEDFRYDEFMKRLEDKKESFNPAQLTGLQQRMALLTSFLDARPRSTPLHERFAAGQLTIIDLSDPFIDPASACGLFEIITRLFVRAEVGTGKVLVVDEAHKNRPSYPRSYSISVPFLSYIDSPPRLDAFDRVVRLETGEAIVLAPSGFGVFPDGPQVSTTQGTQRALASSQIPKLNQFGRRYILMKTRRRVTKDGGASVLVIED
ncbi:hypothetical protein J3R83DRAFT_1051 [Lanmaoa asiatica]|nr:hypothetical protein J3R83DRAFT_1051 [Lanmaoa asiatica]